MDNGYVRNGGHTFSRSHLQVHYQLNYVLDFKTTKNNDERKAL